MTAWALVRNLARQFLHSHPPPSWGTCVEYVCIQVFRTNQKQWEVSSFEDQVQHFQQLLVMAQKPAGWRFQQRTGIHIMSKTMNRQQIENEKKIKIIRLMVCSSTSREKPGSHTFLSYKTFPCICFSYYNCHFSRTPARLLFLQLRFPWEMGREPYLNRQQLAQHFLLLSQ